MGGSDYPRPDTMGSIISRINAKVANQATSPNASFSTVQGGATRYTDTNGQTRVNSGSYTFTSGPYKGQTISAVVTFDQFGNPLLIQGQQPDGSHGFGVYDQLGRKVSFLGAQGFVQYNTGGQRLAQLGTAGLSSFDASGNPRSIVGLLPSGDYGLGVYPIGGGTVQEVLPSSPAEVDATVNITSTSAVSAGGPVVTASVGASGTVDITAAAFIGTTAAGLTGTATVYVDGAPTTASIAVSAAAGATAVSASNTRQVTGLTPGAHTFELLYQTSAGSTNFSARTLTVQPI